MHIGRRQPDAELLVQRHFDAHLSEQVERGRDIPQVRHVLQAERFRRQEACAKDRQRRILRTGNAHFPGQRHAALD